MTVALADLLAQPRSPLQPVALRAGAVSTWRDLRASVRATIAALDGAPGGSWALFEADAFRFACGLLALLHSGRRPLLPGNAQAGTLAELRGEVGGFLGAFDGVPAQPIATAVLDSDAELPAMAADAAIELMTSGSTAGPRRIVKSLRQLDAELACQARCWGDALREATVLASVSHQHIYGLLFRLLLPLVCGRPFQALAHDYNESLFGAVATLPRAVVVSSPAHLGRLPEGIDWVAVRPRLALLLSSGGPLPAAAAQQLQALAGAAPLEIFGSTETGGVAWRRQLAGGEPWQPLPGVVVSADGEEGLLRVRSAWADGGEQIMGDCVTLLADGGFTLQGRADEIVKLEEKRLSLSEMCRRLEAHALVAEARALPLPGAGRLGAVVVLDAAGRAALARSGRRALAAQLREHLLQFFERVLLPRRWRFVEVLPRNSQGKVTRDALQALFVEPAAAPGELRAEAAASCHIAIDLARCAEVFEGHFPGLPVLAGVRQLDWAIRHARRWYPQAPFRSVEQLKFREAIPPGLALDLRLSERGNGAVDFVYSVGTNTLSSGRIRFEAADDQ